MQKPLQIQSSGELPIAPYALGVWLGDGTCSGSEITLFDQDAAEIAQNIRKELGNENLTVCDYGQEDHAVLTVLSKLVHRNREKEKTGQARLRQLGLLNNKHIPKEYLRADCSDRLALLQGMLDTDGYADRKGHVEIIIKYSRLAEDFAELLSSLGIKFGMGLKTVMFDGKEHGPYHRFHFNGYRDQDFFQLKRKRERMRVRPVRRKTEKGCLSHTPCDVRMIVNIEKVPTVPTQCVMVDSPSHLSLHFVWPAYNRSSALRQDLSKLNHELQEKIDESVSLNREVHDLEHSPAAAEKVAREKYNLCKENELILKYEN